MARITVDDCLKRIPNRFQLTLAATYRARQLTNGATPLVDLDRHDKDKPTVVALREEKSAAVAVDAAAAAPAAAAGAKAAPGAAAAAPAAAGAKAAAPAKK